MKQHEEVLIKLIVDNGLNIFSNKKIMKISPLSYKETEIALRNLTNRDFIISIEKGKYCRHNFRDELVIGNFLGRNGGIGYWTAMHYHGLTEQIPNVVYVQTEHQKQNKSIFGVKYVFVQVKQEKLIGFSSKGYGNHQFNITDLEKTIVDCFDMPKYAGGFFEIIKAFNNANLKARKLVRYCKAVNNIAVIKRLGYLSELLQKKDMEYFINYAQSVKNEKYNVFEVGGEPKGKTNSRWNLILNMDEEEILEIANS